MRPYEAMVVLRPALEEAALEATLDRFTSVIAEQGGEITHVDQWGKRRLAYTIDDQIEGFYVVIKFRGNPGITTELERVMRISDAVMRFLVVRDETPAAVPASTTEEPAAKEDAPAEAEAADDASTSDAEAESAAEPTAEATETSEAEAEEEDAQPAEA